MIDSRWRRYYWFLGGMVALEVWSWLAYSQSWMTWAFVVAMLAALVIGFWKPHWLALATLAELVVGGKGYLLFANIHGQHLSLRLGLFLILFLIWVIDLIRTKKWPYPASLAWPLLALVLWVGIMSLVGILRGNGWGTVFLDANAFLYLGMFFMWWRFLRHGPNWMGTTLTLILAGTTIVALKSWLTTIWFAHDWPMIETYYRWIRNTGIGEITPMTLTASRVFFQSHIYAVITFFIVFGAWLRQKAPTWWLIPLWLSAMGVYISLSRSMWLGLGIGLIAMLAMTWWKQSWRAILRWWVLLPAAMVAFLMYAWAINFPHLAPSHGSLVKQNAILERLQGKGAAQSATARKNQIAPLWKAIIRNPVTGLGFGTAVRYYNPDPRIHGWRTTDAFELGYLDGWLKFGLVGLGLYAWWLWRIGQRVRRTVWWPLFLGGTVALLVIHLTTPYLNHPLGIGWLVYVSCYAYA